MNNKPIEATREQVESLKTTDSFAYAFVPTLIKLGKLRIIDEKVNA